MSEVKWIKILTDIFDDDAIQIIESMPDGDSLLIIWFKLLAKAGKINNGGLVYFKENIPYTEEMLATVFNKPISTIRLALQTFIQVGFIELTDTKQILIRNWEKHQNTEKLEEIRRQTNARVQRHRERQKQKLLSCNALHSVTVTEQSALRNGELTHLEEDKEEDIELDKDIIEVEEEKKETSSTSTSSNDEINFYGEYLNVGLSKANYGKLLSFVMNQKKLDELIEQFGINVEIGKENKFTYSLPNAHFLRLIAYWKTIKRNPNKFKNEKESEVPPENSFNDLMDSWGNKNA